MITIKIAVAGNPNSGKTTVFNQLTGSYQTTGNWTGVTVDIATGKRKIGDVEVTFIDLPGTYSLSTHSQDEKVARDFILTQKPDAIINVVDATALEHNLFLTLQILELGVPMVIALNMFDIVEKRGFKIDLNKLSCELGVPVITTSGVKGKGIEELAKIACKTAIDNLKPTYTTHYGQDIEASAERIQNALSADEVAKTIYPLHFFAHKLLERDPLVEASLETIEHPEIVHRIVDEEIEKLTDLNGDVETLVADRRYELANKLARTVSKSHERNTVVDKIDRVVLGRFAIPIFALVMFAIFSLTFQLAEPLTGLISNGFAWLGGFFETVLPGWGGALLKSVIADGLGGVLSLLPNIFILFVFIAVLEDSGYMARVAYIMDGLMSRIGLSGKAFIPFVVAYGCSVPAVMATRALDTKRERIVTMLTAPFVSCSSRLAVLFFLAPLFFKTALEQSVAVGSVFAFGTIMALVMVKVLSGTLFKKEKPSALLIELPAYRMPSVKSVWNNSFDRVRHFLVKAGTVIFIGSLIFWVLSYFPIGSSLEASFVGSIAKFLEPMVKPLGFDFRAVIALMFGFVAKEIVASIMTQIEGQSGNAISTWFSGGASAVSFMVFFNLYTPCLATVAAIKAEAGWKWAAFSVFYGIAIAWLSAFVIFRLLILI
ncbi:MAG: ferrous iron transport protein B [Caldisericia bacterium]|nr:ferrous iron transport protein B [Caldisericia bacterium]